MSGETSTIRCVGCGTTATVPRDASVGATRDASGFTHFCNVANGLSLEWACGDKLRYIDMSRVAMLSEAPKEKERQP